MAFLSSLNIAASALTASRLRMDVISENIANAQTTKTADGGPYRRKMVVYKPLETESFQSKLNLSLDSSAKAPKGVKVAKILEDESPFIPVYDPDHPEADENGYVRMPNVDPIKEILDMMAVTRAYDVNITVLNAVKSMAAKALEIGK